MSVVPTVRGPVDSSRLGRVLMHEHVFVLSEELRCNYPRRWDEEARVADAVAKLRALRSRGIDTIVDPTVLGLGRFLPRVARVNEQVDLHIVPATGYYTYTELPFFFQYNGPGRWVDGAEPLLEMFRTDLEEGIGGTGIRAGLLKCAIDQPGLTPDVERVLKAIAATHRVTGAPVTVHTSAANRSGLVAQRLLAEEGVDLTKVVIGHAGDSTDLDYLTTLADAGSLLGMDRFGLDDALPFEQRVETMVALVARGYTDHLVLSHDAACHLDWMPEDRIQATNPRWVFTHISDDVLPALRARGITEEQIDTMLIHNPRRYFER
ncbi:phosphotriesterase family protein [Streptomyces hyaluromycini]|uniref:phosphotriesterase family protein n=1 Tax=Streptomyces hyaluromycini TaxID=1377993 RepID=UPI000B5C69BA|nr:phosphotriesterase [Streptomyces hyaluromycini]